MNSIQPLPSSRRALSKPRRWLLVSLALLAVGGTGRAQTSPPSHTSVAPPAEFKEIREYVRGIVERGEAPSVAVAVVRNGAIVWEEAFGWADRESKIPATPETIYAVGSLSKSITATGVMVLDHRGDLSLDDPVVRHLPPGAIPIREGDPGELTVRRVLQMTGGIPHGWASYIDPYQPPDVLDHLSHSGVVVFPPGDVDMYSNNAYGVLQAVIEGASGQSFAGFMRSEVFAPLGMSDSYARLEPELVEVAAARYDANRDRYSYAQSHFVPAGGAGMFASVRDLARYARFHLKALDTDQRPIFDDEALERMHTLKDPAFPETIMALGWGSVVLPGGRSWLVTNGSISGANSMLTLLPEEGLAVAVLTNFSSGSFADETAIRIVDAALPGFAGEAMGFIQAYGEANAPRPFEPSSEAMGLWNGAIQVGESEISIALELHEDGSARVRLADTDDALIEALTVLQGQISGEFRGRLPGHQHFGDEHDIGLTLRLDGDRLYGYATSTTETEVGGLSIPFYVQLVKEE